MAKRVLKYLRGSSSDGLYYDLTVANQYDKLAIEVFADADFANDTRDRKSITGYAVFLCGQRIVSKSWKQRLIAESTCEAEFIAANEAMKEAIWLEKLIDELGLQRTRTVLFSDNGGAVCLMERPAKHRRTKQISICYLMIREYIKERGVIVKRVASKDNIADIQTKPLAKLLLDKFKAMLGIKRVQPESCD